MTTDQTFRFLDLPEGLRLNCLNRLDGSSVVSSEGNLLRKYGDLTDILRVNRSCRRLAIEASTGCSIIISDLSAHMLDSKAIRDGKSGGSTLQGRVKTSDAATRFKQSIENRAGTWILSLPASNDMATRRAWSTMTEAALHAFDLWLDDPNIAEGLLPRLRAIRIFKININVMSRERLEIPETADFDSLPNLVSNSEERRSAGLLFSCSAVMAPVLPINLPNVIWTHSDSVSQSPRDGPFTDLVMNHTVELDCSGIARWPVNLQEWTTERLGLIVEDYLTYMNRSQTYRPSETTIHLTVTGPDDDSSTWLKNHKDEFKEKIQSEIYEGFRHRFKLRLGGEKHDCGYKVEES